MSRAPRSDRLGMYSDVKQILDAALAAGGGEYSLPTHGKAVHWRQRAYKFRKLFAEVHHARDMSKYDSIVMPRIEPHETTVRFQIRHVEGEFKPAAGAPVNFDAGPDDDLLDFASSLAKQIEGE